MYLEHGHPPAPPARVPLSLPIWDHFVKHSQGCSDLSFTQFLTLSCSYFFPLSILLSSLVFRMDWVIHYGCNSTLHFSTSPQFPSIANLGLVSWWVCGKLAWIYPIISGITFNIYLMVILMSSHTRLPKIRQISFLNSYHQWS